MTILFSRSNLNDALCNPFNSRLGIIIFLANTLVIFLSMINVVLSTIWDFIDTNDDLTHFVIIDLICNIYFIIEWLCRIFFAENRLDTLKSPVILLEGLSNLIVFVDIEFLLSPRTDWIISGWVPLLCTLRCLRLCRICWHSFQLQMAWKAVKQSRDGLIMMVILIVITLLFLGNIMFYAEALSCKTVKGIRYYTNGPHSGKPCSFQNLNDAIYYAITTITTTGYGDYTPKTSQGKIIGAFIMLLAILMFTFPITIISAHLTDVYLTQKQKKRFKKNKIINNDMTDKDLSKALLRKCQSDIKELSIKLELLNSVIDQVSTVLNTLPEE